MSAYIKLANFENATDIQDCIEDQARQAWALSEFLLAYHNDVAAGDRATMSSEIELGLLENLCERLEVIRHINERAPSEVSRG